MPPTLKVPEWEQRVFEAEVAVLPDVDALLLGWLHRMWKRHGVPYEVSLVFAMSYEDFPTAETYICSYWPRPPTPGAGNLSSGPADSDEDELPVAGGSRDDAEAETAMSGEEATGKPLEEAERRDTSVMIEEARRRRFGEGVKERRTTPMLTWNESKDLWQLIELLRKLKEPPDKDEGGQVDATEAVIEMFGSEDDDAIGFLAPPTGIGMTLRAARKLADLSETVLEIVLHNPFVTLEDSEEGGPASSLSG